MVDRIEAQADPSGWTASESLAGWLGAQLLAILWSGGVLSMQPGRAAGGPQDSIWWFLLGAVGLWVGYFGVSYWLSRRHEGGPVDLAGGRPSAVELLIGAVAGVVAQVALVPVVYNLLGDAIAGDPEASARTLVGLVDSVPEIIGLTVAVVVLAPLAEEVMYRGVLLRGFAARMGPGPAIAATSVIFAAAHGELILMPGLVAFAVVLGLLAHWSEGLAAPVAAHMAFNATTVVLLLGG